MKYSIFLLSITLLFLVGCSNEKAELIDQDGDPAIQLSTMSYDPTSAESVVLNSHPVYGPMFLSQQNGHIDRVYIIEDGPLECYNEHPYFPERSHYVCGEESAICVVVVSSFVAQQIFTTEGVNWNGYSSPEVMVAVYNNRSEMMLVNNHIHNSGAGTHQFQLIKILR